VAEDFDSYDCYSILGVTYNATYDEIKQAYRKLVLRYHPDRNKAPEADKVFRTIRACYDKLVNPDARRKYDSKIAALTKIREEKIKVILEGTATEGYAWDDHATINIVGTDENIVFENSLGIPTVWIHTHDSHRPLQIHSSEIFRRLFISLFHAIAEHENLDDLMIYGKPELRAHFDAAWWNRGQTNVSLYCNSSMSVTIIDGLPYIYLYGAIMHDTNAEVTVNFYNIMKNAIQDIIYAELKGTVQEQYEGEERSIETIFTPVKDERSIEIPSKEICGHFVRLCRNKSVQDAINMLATIYGVPPMKTYFQNTAPINDNVCKNALAVYYSAEQTAYFKPAGFSMKTILHEFYHHLVHCYGISQMLPYEMLPDPITGYYMRNDQEEKAAESFAHVFLDRAIRAQ
jgi:curved DNA-binding protein CbpA